VTGIFEYRLRRLSLAVIEIQQRKQLPMRMVPRLMQLLAEELAGRLELRLVTRLVVEKVRSLAVHWVQQSIPAVRFQAILQGTRLVTEAKRHGYPQLDSVD
jgi:hypothetical protein